MHEGEIRLAYSIGIDIGSTSTKTAVIDHGDIVSLFVQPTGWSSVDSASSVRERLEREGLMSDGALCVATGYGRVAVPFADKAVTEITCHALGAMKIHGVSDAMVIDIGGQDTKVIKIEDGSVRDFVMNDKCSAGTGRFLEVMANSMAMRPEDMCALASLGGGTTISSMCTVFAESEVISLIGRGERREDIAFAVVDSIVRKVASQASRFERSKRTVLTGGLSKCPYVREALSREMRVDIESDDRGQFAGAIGAAMIAEGV